MPLDRTRPFGTISPLYKGANYTQSGKYFDPDGLEIDLKTGDLLEEPEPQHTGDELIPTPANVRALLELSQKIPMTDIRVKAAVMFGKEPPAQNTIAWIKSQAARLSGPARVVGNPGGVDLGAWGRGEKKYFFDEVRRAIRDTLHRDVVNSTDAKQTLIEAGLLNPSFNQEGPELEPMTPAMLSDTGEVRSSILEAD